LIILGIDPAIRTTGYGVIEIDAQHHGRILDCGIIENKAKLSHTECLRRLSGGIRELVGKYQLESAAIEEPFVGRNSKTAIILGMARGAILAALAENGIPVASYTPATAKKAAVGIGQAEKEQVAVMMAAEFGIELADIPLDATDALAIAVCHAQKLANPETAGLLIKYI